MNVKTVQLQTHCPARASFSFNDRTGIRPFQTAEKWNWTLTQYATLFVYGTCTDRLALVPPYGTAEKSMPEEYFSEVFKLFQFSIHRAGHLSCDSSVTVTMAFKKTVEHSIVNDWFHFLMFMRCVPRTRIFNFFPVTMWRFANYCFHIIPMYTERIVTAVGNRSDSGTSRIGLRQRAFYNFR